MSDNREVFVNRIKARIGTVLEPEIARAIVNEIIKELSNYEISERCTDLVVPDGANDKILKRYCACLNIDGKSNGTIYQYHRSCKRLAETIPKNYTEMGAYDIRYFLALEKDRGVSNRSLENTRANLSAFFQWMAIEDVIPKNPCASIKSIKYTEECRKPFFETEIDALRGACKNVKERAIIETLLSSGLRVSELIGLDQADVDPINYSVRVRHGKGDKERVTYMTSVAMRHYKKYLSGRTDEHPAAFLNRCGDRLTANGVRSILNKIGERAKVEDVHPHRFRRTFATVLAKRGMDVQEIMKLLGHTNINTTMVYVYTDDSLVQTSYKKYAV